MSYSQIRITKTEEIAEALAYLKKKYQVLNTSEVVKMLIAQKYNQLKSFEKMNCLDDRILRKKIYTDHVDSAQKISEKKFNYIWNNDEDSVYDNL